MEARVSPLHYSLMETVPTFAGAEKSLAVANIAFTLAFVMAAQIWQWALVGPVIHVLLVWLTKRDPLTRKIYIRYRRQGLVYDPWPRAGTQFNPRPQGFCQGALC